MTAQLEHEVSDAIGSIMSSHEAYARAQLVRWHRTLAAAKRHTPKWLAALITIALLIPGPQDELLVVVILAAWAAFKPVMRRDIAIAWDIYR
ncbi:hypothetical protein [Mycobacterium avium]|uniref:hypothetical protein n=1 Tax=Mycobacterium avium TaxID=1764 RepID=UPI001CC4CFB2|nr:hypothetical protein [Mycobacterium avium]MBZ4537766.1 hypothetical protein [Mycobacterium avium subsp. hominissuis]MBZ4594928.1 hypothetical protein [Mycobacterium avium subsp. hominissuis]MBZ4637666.1 hypothetical protein [Mycobacterium avium subsp. hominissuis]